MTETNQSTIHPTGVARMTELSAVQPGGGNHRFFLNHLGTVKVCAEDAPSGMGAVEFRAPRGFATPVHVHDDQDELLYIIDGEIRVGQGDDAYVVGTGSYVTLPAGIPHVFQVVSDEARFVSVTAGRSPQPTFEDFVVAISDAADPDDMPEPVEVDPGHVALVSAAHGIQIIGPPPGPLD